MYAVYEKSLNTDGTYQLKMLRKISLAGCNNGIICEELADIIKPTDSFPIGWTIPMAAIYAAAGHTVIIDLKPNNDSETVIYELDTVFGFSYQNWSPIMFRLKELFNEEKEGDFDIENFSYSEEGLSIVYTMTYLTGGIQGGQLKEKWIFPNRSSTNSVLFWPDAMTFFMQKIKEYDPHFLTANIKTTN
jgi:hypothetical protein